MKQMGMHTGMDLKKCTEEELVKHFGKTGYFYYRIVRGIDDRPVQPHRETKSLGAEDTFVYDLTQVAEMNTELERIAQLVYDRLQRYQLKGRTVTLKIKYSDFHQITRNQSFLEPICDKDIILETAKRLLLGTEPENKKIRLLGISLSNFGEIAPKQKKPGLPGQLRLF